MAMDFISGPTAAPTTVAGMVTPRTPDSDTDTPPHPPPSKRAHHYVSSNGGDSHGGEQNQHVSYKECMKNHAASIGGHALDGCCEFMPGPTANALDPTSLTCAACGCHRNFHRRDPDDPTPLHHLVPHSTAARRPHSPPSASQLLLSLSGHAHSPPDHETIHNSTAATSAPTGGAVMMGFFNNNGGGGGQNGNFQSKKRFRTRFSQEQKEKMYEFSEKIGWKLKKGEERLVQEFCQQVGVDRSVFKVWMHNNKHSSSASASASASAFGSAPVTISALDSASASPQRRDKTGIITTTTTTTTATTMSGASSNGNANNSNNANNSSNVGLNCGGVIGSALEFNFANGSGQEAKAQ